VVVWPRVTDWLAGVAEMVKSGAGPLVVTVRVGDALWLKEPLAPLMVRAKAPVAAAAEAVRVKVELPDPVIEAGLKAAVTPEGNPAADSATVPLNPLSALMVTVKVVWLPCATVREPGEAERVKSPPAVGVALASFELPLSGWVPQLARAVTT
jgi:hypothetical protein